MEKKIFNCCRCGKVMGPLDDYKTGGDWFMVKNELWLQVTRKDDRVICKDCFEKILLGRSLKEEDLMSCPMNYPVVVHWVEEGKISKEKAREIIERMFNEKITTSQFPKEAQKFKKEALKNLTLL